MTVHKMNYMVLIMTGVVHNMILMILCTPYRSDHWDWHDCSVNELHGSYYDWH